ncbi:hypothetical protein GCM10010911_11650 [Paenibacillus nasutitermitis]|uniref:Uncharacterized protein n=2 Tax=Paenibacillus nasutitermitis TaxID=1652958 RepID=A0A916YQ95_9BACL|nr:hypothetical protein GCM10010911_11650 [Paenibacillus nasutitermitis]
MSAKRIGLVLSSEETYPGAALGITHQIQEFSRYTRSEFIGVVRGVGNSRGEVESDPSLPVAAAVRLGQQFFELNYTDYNMNTVRSSRVWPKNE